jgi:hypothetical protein
MNRNLFEGDEDPSEEIPLFEKVQRNLGDNDVDDTLFAMSDAEKEMAVHSQFKDVEKIDANIASLKQQGLWATARFYERLRAQR